jgi:hypothetical protein
MSQVALLCLPLDVRIRQDIVPHASDSFCGFEMKNKTWRYTNDTP